MRIDTCEYSHQFGPNENESCRFSPSGVTRSFHYTLEKTLADSRDKFEHVQSRGERKTFRPNESESLNSLTNSMNRINSLRLTRDKIKIKLKGQTYEKTKRTPTIFILAMCSFTALELQTRQRQRYGTK